MQRNRHLFIKSARRTYYWLTHGLMIAGSCLVAIATCVTHPDSRFLKKMCFTSLWSRDVFTTSDFYYCVCVFKSRELYLIGWGILTETQSNWLQRWLYNIIIHKLFITWILRAGFFYPSNQPTVSTTTS